MLTARSAPAVLPRLLVLVASISGLFRLSPHGGFSVVLAELLLGAAARPEELGRGSLEPVLFVGSCRFRLKREIPLARGDPRFRLNPENSGNVRSE